MNCGLMLKKFPFIHDQYRYKYVLYMYKMYVHFCTCTKKMYDGEKGTTNKSSNKIALAVPLHFVCNADNYFIFSMS